jgi:hypothetical protein
LSCHLKKIKLWIQSHKPEHFWQTQARPLDSSGTNAKTSEENTASKHQQCSALLPVKRAISMAQALGSLQMGQSVGSTLNMYKYFQGDNAFFIVVLLSITSRPNQ